MDSKSSLLRISGLHLQQGLANILSFGEGLYDNYFKFWELYVSAATTKLSFLCKCTL